MNVWMDYMQVLGSGKPSSAPGQPRVSNILDNMTASKKSTSLSGSAGKPGKGPVLKPLAPKAKAKVLSLVQYLNRNILLNIGSPHFFFFHYLYMDSVFLLFSPDSVQFAADDEQKNSQ